MLHSVWVSDFLVGLSLHTLVEQKQFSNIKISTAAIFGCRPMN